MIIKVFTQPKCPRCPSAKELIKKIKDQSANWRTKIKIEEYDVSTVGGLAEASFYTVLATPSVLLCSDQGKVIKDWRGDAPSLTEIKAFLK